MEEGTIGHRSSGRDAHDFLYQKLPRFFYENLVSHS